MIDLKPACDRMVEVLQRVTDDQLTGSTPCTEYTVADLIDHVDLVSRGSVALVRQDSGELRDTDAAHSSPGWRDNVAQHVLALGKAWDEPAAWQGRTDVAGLALPNEVWGKIALTELVVHGWDIAKATGQPFDLLEHDASLLRPRGPVRPGCPDPGPMGSPGARCARRHVARPDRGDHRSCSVTHATTGRATSWCACSAA